MTVEHLKKIPFTSVLIEDKFWAPRLNLLQENTIKACFEQCEVTGRIENFEKAAQGIGEFEGVCFNDSDIYKIIEGVGYSLMNNPNEELEQYTDQLIDKIEAAQEADGYLDTYFTLGRADQKWTDMMAHEAYCAGHFIESAVSYYAATKKEKILNIAIKLADHLVETFLSGQRHFTVGHQEIELALVKLYEVTRNEKYIELAKWFIEERGHHYGFTDIAWNRDSMGGEPYNQDDFPIRELKDIKGHAVRAMYYFTAVTDLAMMNHDEGYLKALDRLWESTVLRNMYLTGGIGSSHTNEGFGGDYFLPNDEAYCETCASIGMIYWNSRMNRLKKEGKYADIIEKELYNGALSGLSLDGRKFFYVNPLESDGLHHRESWYGVSCCPTQLARFIPSIGDYVYAQEKEAVYVNLYMASTAKIEIENEQVTLTQKTSYPYDGVIDLLIQTPKTINMSLYFRYPDWAKSASLTYNGKSMKPCFEKGYLKVNLEISDGDTFTLDFPMPVERIKANPKVTQNTGCVALTRGPLVYCFEEVDQTSTYDRIEIAKDDKIVATHDEQLLGGVVKLDVFHENEIFTAVPYYAWDNREPGKMKVWVVEAQAKGHELLYSDCFK